MRRTISGLIVPFAAVMACSDGAKAPTPSQLPAPSAPPKAAAGAAPVDLVFEGSVHPATGTLRVVVRSRTTGLAAAVPAAGEDLDRRRIFSHVSRNREMDAHAAEQAGRFLTGMVEAVNFTGGTLSHLQAVIDDVSDTSITFATPLARLPDRGAGRAELWRGGTNALTWTFNSPSGGDFSFIGHIARRRAALPCPRPSVQRQLQPLQLRRIRSELGRAARRRRDHRRRRNEPSRAVRRDPRRAWAYSTSRSRPPSPPAPALYDRGARGGVTAVPATRTCTSGPRVHGRDGVHGHPLHERRGRPRRSRERARPLDDQCHRRDPTVHREQRRTCPLRSARRRGGLDHRFEPLSRPRRHARNGGRHVRQLRRILGRRRFFRAGTAGIMWRRTSERPLAVVVRRQASRSSDEHPDHEIGERERAEPSSDERGDQPRISTAGGCVVPMPTTSASAVHYAVDRVLVGEVPFAIARTLRAMATLADEPVRRVVRAGFVADSVAARALRPRRGDLAPVGLHGGSATTVGAGRKMQGAIGRLGRPRARRRARRGRRGGDEPRHWHFA